MSKHTPGPWKYGLSDEGNFQLTLHIDDLANTNIGFARVYRHQTDEKKQAEAEANARLIAAAPEMLEALKIVVGNLTAHGNATPLLFGALIKAEKAIAKAEGK